MMLRRSVFIYNYHSAKRKCPVGVGSDEPERITGVMAVTVFRMGGSAGQAPTVEEVAIR
jgi:hypothetical protein